MLFGKKLFSILIEIYQWDQGFMFGFYVWMKRSGRTSVLQFYAMQMSKPGNLGGPESLRVGADRKLTQQYLFDPDFCNVASGWEKGVVEKNVQDSCRRIWIEAQTLRFGSFVELNLWLAQRCRALWDELRYPEHPALSVADVLEQ